MPSAIDPTRPPRGVPASKAALRANFAAAKQEIEHLQGAAGIDVREFGAVGDGSTDDTVALQAAIDAHVPLAFPTDHKFKLTAPLEFDDEGVVASGMASRGSSSRLRAWIYGNFEGPLLKPRNFNLPPIGPYVQDGYRPTPNLLLQDLTFENDHLAGTCVVTHHTRAPTMFMRCDFRFAYRGLIMTDGNFNSVVMNCRFTGTDLAIEEYGGAGYEYAFGLLMPGHVTAIECDFHRCGTAVGMTKLGNNLIGGRIEVSRIGATMGCWHPKYDKHIDCLISTITGTSFEDNGIGVNCTGMGHGSSIRSISIIGSSYDGVAGVKIRQGKPSTTISNVQTTGSYGEGALWIADNNARTDIQPSCNWKSVKADSPHPGYGPSTARPDPAQMPIGRQWLDMTTGKLLVSDGANWRDASGTIV